MGAGPSAKGRMNGRSVAAVAAGLATLAGVQIGLSWLYVRMPPPATMPSPLQIALVTLGLALLAEVPAGFVTAWVARRSVLRHCAALAVAVALLGGAVLSAIGASGFANGVALNVLQAPGILLGGWLRQRAGSG